MADPRATSSAVGPVHRAFGLLQSVVAAEEPVGVRELARRTGLTKSTVGRLLATLDELRMVERLEGGRAIPGPGLDTLSKSKGNPATALRERFRQLLPELVERFGESAAIGVDRPGGFLYLATERGPSAVQVPDGEGQAYPFHVVAPGLIAMAEWDAGRLERFLAEPRSMVTTHSVTTKGAIRHRLRQARRDRFVWTDQELDLEVNGLAAPVRLEGELVAVVSLYGPSYRFSPSARPGLAAEFRDYVEQRVASMS